MTAPRKKHCPVCLQLVGRSMGNSIVGHIDNVGIPCLASGEPYRITLSFRHSYVKRARAAA